MLSLNIAVPESARDFIERQVAAGGFADADQYILSLIEADRRNRLRSQIEAEVIRGLASPSAPLDDAEWDDIRQTGERLIAQKRAR
jgi:antitoxin ParD1/3/4